MITRSPLHLPVSWEGVTSEICFALIMVFGICSQAHAQGHDSSQRVRERLSVNTQGDVNGSALVTRLEVKIVTRNDRGAGTDNAVYFDIGPLGWKLNKSWHNDFERGDTYTYSLPAPENLFVDDILWLRLHKKGILGITGTRDGFDGAWHPQTVTLIVNGVSFPSVNVDRPLNSRIWFWRKLRCFDAYADPASFARSLRLKPNDKLSWVAKATSFATTPLFKKQGISGWLNCPEEKENLGLEKPCSRLPSIVCATGGVFRRPAVSTDGLATIDLALEALGFCSDRLTCIQRAELTDAQHPRRARYVRVEYRHRKNRVPIKGERVRICGKLLWDTDREGWWEIHPRDSRDIAFLQEENSETPSTQNSLTMLP